MSILFYLFLFLILYVEYEKHRAYALKIERLTRQETESWYFLFITKNGKK